MSKILVTGADGFIGSHLVEGVLKQGHDVRAFCYYNSFGHAGWLSGFKGEHLSHLEIVYGDIRDAGCVEDAVEGCDAVFHLASLIAIPYSYKAPSSYIETNVNGTLNVLMAARKTGCSVIHTSTSEVYGTAEYIPINESHPLKPQSPYSASKIAADQIALSFYYSFNLPISIVRPFNTFGPRQSARAVISTIIQQILSGKKMISLGILDSTRDFTFVEDTVAGMVAFLGNEKTIGQVINLGTGFEISIKDLSLQIADLMGKSVDFSVSSDRLRPEKSEVMRLVSDNRKAKELLGWSPASSSLEGLRHGLKKTIDWFAEGEHGLPTTEISGFVY
jgi:NAD dependent epimerase/dehydratase